MPWRNAISWELSAYRRSEKTKAPLSPVEEGGGTHEPTMSEESGGVVPFFALPVKIASLPAGAMPPEATLRRCGRRRRSKGQPDGRPRGVRAEREKREFRSEDLDSGVTWERVFSGGRCWLPGLPVWLAGCLPKSC